MTNSVEAFFKTLSSKETMDDSSEGVTIETYTCEDLHVGRNAFAFWTQHPADYDETIYNEDNETAYILCGFTICIETYKRDGSIRCATISPTYESDEELNDTDLHDIVRGLDEVLAARNNAECVSES